MARKGFTLIELLVVIVIIGILVAIALPNFIKIKDKAKEAEVKQNLHSIQLALERYAVDAVAAEYPLQIMGGDWTDSFVVWQIWVDNQNLTMSDVNPTRASGWKAAPGPSPMPGGYRGDPLVMEAYMPSYPRNPFNQQGGSSLLPTIDHTDFLSEPQDRIVGGRESNKMYEVFGPVEIFTGLTEINGDLYVHHPFNNPPYGAHSLLKTPAGSTPWRSPSGNKRLVGNFSYWARSGNQNAFPWTTGPGGVQGYTLAGYGALRTGGQDVYNRNGNYVGRFRTSDCGINCLGYNMGDVPCLCGSTNPPSIQMNDGGSDTIIDAVVITLDSGVDKASKRTNAETTEGV